MTPPSGHAGLRRLLGCAAIVAAGAALPFVYVIATGRTAVWRDTALLFEAVRPSVVEALRDGRLPLWSPHEAFGIPLLGQQLHAVLHPVSLVMALVAPGAGMDAFAIAYIVLAAWGAAALARVLGASWEGTCAAGLAFGLSGYALSMSAVIQYLAGASTAPWVVAGLVAAGQGRRHGVAAAAVAVAAMSFAGEPQWAIVAVVIGLSLATAAGGKHGALRAAAGLGIGLLLGGIQLLPAWAHFRESSRAGGLARSDEFWALSPWRIVELVAPGFFGGEPGRSLDPVYFALDDRPRFGIPFVPSISIGAAALSLGAWGARSSRAGRILAAAAGVSLWIALGPAVGATQLLSGVPVWGAFRYPEKLVGPLTLCVAVLSAFGVDRLAEARRPSFRGPLVAAGVAALASVALLALARTASTFPIADPAVADAARVALGTGLAHAAVAFAAVALLASGRLGGERWTPVAAVAVVFALSLAAAPFAVHAGPRGVRGAPRAAELRRPGELVRIGVPAPSIPTTGAPDRAEYERASAIISRMGVADHNVASGIDNVEAVTGLRPARWERVRTALNRAFGPQQVWIAWRRFAMSHVVVGPIADEGSRATVATAVSGATPVLAGEPGPVQVWAVPHRPWAFFAEQVVPASGPEDAVAKLVDVLESADASVVVEGRAPDRLSPGRVLAVERAPERIRLEAESSGPALLVVADAYWGGWDARVDGRPTPILPADGFVRAVAWPPGRHVLEMTYRPGEVTAGIVATAVGLAIVAALVARTLGLSRTRRSAAARRPER